MKSISARLAVWYALAATLTLACLSVIGYFALQKNLIDGLDLLNSAQFNEIKAHLGPDYRTLSPQAIDDHIRETTDYASVLFYIDLHDRQNKSLFLSNNLRGRPIPDLIGQHAYNVVMPEIGELRAGEFLLPPFEVMIATSAQPARGLLRVYIQVSSALVAIMLLVSVAIGFGLTHIALRPVYLFEETADHIRSDNLGERIPVQNLDEELASLGRLLNRMFDRLESSFNQIRRFTGEASHELKTPLSLIRLQAERMVMEGGLNSQHEEALHMQLEEVTRLNRIIDDLLLISRAEAGAVSVDRRSQDPGLFLQGITQDARTLAEHRGMTFLDSHDGAGTASFDPKWIRQVLLNLVSNALNVSPPGGTVTVRSILTNHTWHVSVDDMGPGVPAEARERIFEPFVRLPGNSAPGTGLGLTICRSIVELHKGRIWSEAAGGGPGLRVSFELPISDQQVAAPIVSSEKPPRFSWDPRVIWARLSRHQQWHPD